MYIPKPFSISEIDKLIDMIRKNSFGILFSHQADHPMATHLPFIIDEKRGELGYLYGHMAKGNPHWKEINHEVLVVFQGPHCYISPAWYEEEDAVPTWNYVAVHVYGEFSLIEDKDLSIQNLKDAVDFYESSMPEPWYFDPNHSFAEKMMKGIAPFEIKINKIEGKWKLSQNQSAVRQERVISALKKSSDPDALEIARLMEDNLTQ
jgi:transcriptional regulator